MKLPSKALKAFSLREVFRAFSVGASEKQFAQTSVLGRSAAVSTQFTMLYIALFNGRINSCWQQKQNTAKRNKTVCVHGGWVCACARARACVCACACVRIQASRWAQSQGPGASSIAAPRGLWIRWLSSLIWLLPFQSRNT